MKLSGSELFNDYGESDARSGATNRCCALFWLISSIALAGTQSLTVNSTFISGTIPSSSPFAAVGSFTIAGHYHNLTIPGSTKDSVNLGGQTVGTGFAFRFTPAGAFTLVDFAEGSTVYSVSVVGITDFTWMFTRNVATNIHTLELWNRQTGVCTSTSSGPFAPVGNINFGGTVVSSGDVTARIGFWRWSAGLKAGTACDASRQPQEYGATGDLIGYEFEGVLTDASGHGVNASATSPVYTTTPTYVPSCNAGTQQSFRAGAPIVLDFTGSSALNGSATLTYFAQYIPSTLAGVATQSGLVWSSHTSATPTLTGTTFGPLQIQLTITDTSGQSTTCTTKYGVVATDSSGNVVIGNPKTNLLLGPMTRLGVNVYSFPETMQTIFGNTFGALQGTLASSGFDFRAVWLTGHETGTIAVSNGGTTVTGTGTAFGTQYCGGSPPCSPAGPQSIIIWYCTSGAAPACFDSPTTSGRRWFVVSSVTDDTHLTIAGGPYSNWPLATVSGSFWNNWGTSPGAFGSWYGGGAGVNYYDDVTFFYALWYRTGIDDFLTYARWLGDAWWTSPGIDQGTATQGLGIRIHALQGMFLRAIEQDMIAGSAGASSMWPGLRTFVAGSIAIKNSQGNSTGIFDIREMSYNNAEIAYCAAVDPSASQQQTCLTALDAGDGTNGTLNNAWTIQRKSDGSWANMGQGAGWSKTICNADGCAFGFNYGTVSVINGSATITISGAEALGTSSLFCSTGSKANFISWNPASLPGSYDSRYYIVARGSNNTMTIQGTTYQGATASGRYWALSCSVGRDGFYDGADWVGPGTQPYMLGILAHFLRVASYALVNSGTSAPWNTALANTITNIWLPGITNWLGTTGFDSTAKAPWYGVGFGVCNPATRAVNACVQSGSAEEQRTLAGEMTPGLCEGYLRAPSPTLLGYGNTYYASMFAKFPTDPLYDGVYISGLDAGAFFITSQNGKWPGFFWGFGRSHCWASARQGGVAAAISRTLFVSFKMASVPNATQVTLTLTKPDGTTVSSNCASSPCTIQADAREAAASLVLVYKSAGGGILASYSQPIPITLF